MKYKHLLAILPLAIGCRTGLGERWERPDFASYPADGGSTDGGQPGGGALWAMAGQGPERRARSREAGPGMWRQAWEVNRLLVPGPPVVAADGTIYVASIHDPGGLTALDPRSGTILWRANTRGANLAIGPDGTVYVGNLLIGAPRMAAIDPQTRSVRWDSIVPGNVSLPLLVAPSGTIYLVTGSTLAALHPADGRTLWTQSLPDPAVGVALGADGAVIVATGKQVGAHDPSDGRLRWRVPASGTVAAHPVVGEDGTIYLAAGVGANDALIFALDPADGRTLWRHTLDGSRPVSPPAVAPDGSILAGVQHAYVAISPDGKRRWTADLQNADLTGGPVVGADGVSYIVDNVSVRAFAADGRAVFAHRTSVLGLQAGLALGGGLLLVTEETGNVRAIGP